MALETAALLLVFVLSILGFFFRGKKHERLPPGPTPIPILGNLHLVKISPHLVFAELRKKYGDIFSFKFGSYPGVILCGPQIIREAMNETAFSGRHTETAAFPRRGGVGMNDGKEWAEQRRFTLKTLRDFGFGKKSVETLITDEVEQLVETFKKSCGTPNDLQGTFNAAVLNTLWSMIAGERFNHDDPRLTKLITLLNMSVKTENLTLLDKLSFFITWLHPLRNKLPKGKEVAMFYTETQKMLQDVIERHKKTIEKDQTRDFIDVYLQEMAKETAVNTSFSRENGERNLPIVLFDLFIAGTETTASTLTYALQYLTLNPEVQEKLYEEIKSVVGVERLPTLADRPKLPYVEATIYEVMRIASLLPQSVNHKTIEDTNFRGYFIPKDTIVIPNLFSVMMDPNIWGDPENFRPERFFGADGSLQKHHEALLPFGIGKRVCLGETLARDQLFLFLTILTQRFSFKADPNSPPLKVEYFITPVILSPIPKNLLLQERTSS